MIAVGWALESALESVIVRDPNADSSTNPSGYDPAVGHLNHRSAIIIGGQVNYGLSILNMFKNMMAIELAGYCRHTDPSCSQGMWLNTLNGDRHNPWLVQYFSAEKSPSDQEVFCDLNHMT